jgi:hypothetical protein
MRGAERPPSKGVKDLTSIDLSGYTRVIRKVWNAGVVWNVGVLWNVPPNSSVYKDNPVLLFITTREGDQVNTTSHHSIIEPSNLTPVLILFIIYMFS